jgi:hypothetical protein
MFKKLTFEDEEKMKRPDEDNVTAGILPPGLMGCLMVCGGLCQSEIEGDGEMNAAFGLIAEPIE